MRTARAWRLGALVLGVLLAPRCGHDENGKFSFTGEDAMSAVESQNSSPEAVEFFISLQGNDAWSGRKAEPDGNDGPFATLARAQLAVREMHQTKLAHAVRVTLRAGTYYLDEPLEFYVEDAGTDEYYVTYAAVSYTHLTLPTILLV